MSLFYTKLQNFTRFFLSVAFKVSSLIWIFWLLGFRNKSHTLIANAIEILVTLSGSAHTFSSIFDIYVILDSNEDKGSNNLLRQWAAGPIFHLLISSGVAFVFILGKFASPKMVNTASLILAVNVPRKLRCFDTSYLNKIIH